MTSAPCDLSGNMRLRGRGLEAMVRRMLPATLQRLRLNLSDCEIGEAVRDRQDSLTSTRLPITHVSSLVFVCSGGTWGGLQMTSKSNLREL